MASATEQHGSRLGTGVSTSGPLSIPMSFDVTVDDVYDDPITVCQQMAVPVGAHHPVYSYAIASDYILRERKGRLTWVVEVFFRAEWEVAQGNWRMSVSSALERVKILETIESVLGVRKAIGPRVYKPVPQEEGTHYAVGLHGTQYLQATEARIIEGYDVPWPVLTMRLTRRQPSFPTNAIGTIGSVVGLINKDTFFGAQPGTLMFMGFTLDEETGVLAGQTTAGVIYAVSVIFDWNLAGFSPIQRTATWRDQEGHEARVVDNTTGLYVVEAFDVIQGIQFSTLMGLFE